MDADGRGTLVADRGRRALPMYRLALQINPTLRLAMAANAAQRCPGAAARVDPDQDEPNQVPTLGMLPGRTQERRNGLCGSTSSPDERAEPEGSEPSAPPARGRGWP